MCAIFIFKLNPKTVQQGKLLVILPLMLATSKKAWLTLGNTVPIKSPIRNQITELFFNIAQAVGELALHKQRLRPLGFCAPI